MMRDSNTTYQGNSQLSQPERGTSWNLKQIQLSSEGLRENLPPWLGGPKFDPLLGMLKTLKVAAESYLEEPLVSALAIVSFPISPSFRQHTIATASQLSLRLFSTRWRQGGRQAWEARHGVDLCDEDHPVADKLVLTVEYSRAALTGLVIEVMCNIMSTARKLHFPNLGQDGLASDATLLDFEKALREITSLPMKKNESPNTKAKVFDSLVILGEAAHDERLHEVLTRVLGEQYQSLMNDNIHSRGSTQKPPFPRYDINPLYAASQGSAHDCWYRLKAIEDQGGPCKLSPGLSDLCVEKWADNWGEDSETD
jgi:hypothetical protein